jgi:hypothetical protein
MLNGNIKVTARSFCKFGIIRRIFAGGTNGCEKWTSIERGGRKADSGAADRATNCAIRKNLHNLNKPNVDCRCK